MDRATLIENQRKHYRDHGWAKAPKVLPVEVADAALYKIQQELGGDWESYKGDYIKTFLTDKKAYECYSFDYTPMAMLQWGLTPYMSTVVGKDLLPSHAYFRVYRSGDVCHLHSDAMNCEHAMSLTLGYSDDLMWGLDISEKYYEAGEKRPAEVAQQEGRIKLHNVVMNTGDAVIYNGINYIHGRVTPNPNRWSAQIFLHWVDRAGKFARHAFDDRAGEVVRRADFVFPDDDAPEKVNPNRAEMVKERGR
ncbi:hypothetical protein [Hyphococcus sp.]|uniref:hypothetical protein n=1 Tax=Hyphococcus sp. TaxID=2038636 RepID=UPI0020850AE1|nr:MAG: hypothetical protein DHS20C04_07630 [Marinicaulis sp.]